MLKSFSFAGKDFGFSKVRKLEKDFFNFAYFLEINQNLR